MNSMYALLLDVDGCGDCPVCDVELLSIGPIHGPVSPPSPRVERWSMTAAEWAGMEV